MKKLVAFVVILSLGLFCAVGCGKAPAKKGGDAGKAGVEAKADAPKEEPKADAPKEEPKADAPKPEEKK